MLCLRSKGLEEVSYAAASAEDAEAALLALLRAPALRSLELTALHCPMPPRVLRLAGLLLVHLAGFLHCLLSSLLEKMHLKEVGWMKRSMAMTEVPHLLGSRTSDVDIVTYPVGEAGEQVVTVMVEPFRKHGSVTDRWRSCSWTRARTGAAGCRAGRTAIWTTRAWPRWWTRSAGGGAPMVRTRLIRPSRLLAVLMGACTRKACWSHQAPFEKHVYAPGIDNTDDWLKSCLPGSLGCSSVLLVLNCNKITHCACHPDRQLGALRSLKARSVMTAQDGPFSAQQGCDRWRCRCAGAPR